MNNDTENYDKRVRKYEAEGLTRSDAQGVVDAEDLKAARAISPGPWTWGSVYVARHINGMEYEHIAKIPEHLNDDNPQWCANARAISLVPEMIEALQKINSLDPSVDSSEGFNEWGEADCFNQAQTIARAILKRIEG